MSIISDSMTVSYPVNTVYLLSAQSVINEETQWGRC